MRFHKRSLRATFAPLLAAVLLLGGCSTSDAGGSTGPSDPSTETFATALGVDLTQMNEVATRLYVQDLVVGTGAEATAGKRLRMRYTGWLRNGTRFDSNTSATGFVFDLGVGQVISGWDIGVAGMREGGRRRLVLGSQYGNGAFGSGSIPPHATLVFEVELVAVLN